MEYLQGASLRQVLEAEGPLSMERAVELLGQVCAGLAHAHHRGVVHRDVKPSNVILVKQRDDDGGEVTIAKVCDFGIATGPATADQGSASVGHVTGTAQYMSPEQCRGEEVDARSDVYSCGVTLYELVTGRLPFEGEERSHFRRLHELAAPTPPSTHAPDIDPLLEQLILKALAKAPGVKLMRSPASLLSEGLRRLAAQTVGVVLLDLNLPDSSGLDTLKSIREAFPETPVLVLGSLPEGTVPLDAIKLGAQDYLAKDEFSGPMLTRAVRYAMERKQAERALRGGAELFRNVY